MSTKPVSVRPPEIVGVVREGGWKGDRVGLTSCEDNEIVRFIDKSGRTLLRAGLRYMSSN